METWIWVIIVVLFIIIVAGILTLVIYNYHTEPIPSGPTPQPIVPVPTPTPTPQPIVPIPTPTPTPQPIVPVQPIVVNLNVTNQTSTSLTLVAGFNNTDPTTINASIRGNGATYAASSVEKVNTGTTARYNWSALFDLPSGYLVSGNTYTLSVNGVLTVGSGNLVGPTVSQTYTAT